MNTGTAKDKVMQVRQLCCR